MTPRIFALLAILLSPNLAHAWWNAEWQFRKEITLDASATGQPISGTATEVPVLVRLHTANFGYFVDLAEGGADLRFVLGDDKTPLKHHVEKFDAVNEMAFVWVKVPALTGGLNTEKIYMYYGNKTAPKGDDPAGTYDMHQALVLHFGEQGAPQDRTGFGNHPDAFNAEPVAASLMGAGARFNGSQSVQLRNKPSLKISPETGWTFSAWMKPAAANAAAVILHVEEGERSLVLASDAGGVFGRYSQKGRNVETSRLPFAAGEWQHVALVAAKDKLTLAVNGASTVASIDLKDIAGTVSIGAKADNSGGFAGELDEVQIAKTARDGAWLSAAVASQTPSSNLLRFGEDQDAAAEGGGSESYFRVILQNVTLDGWVVIVVLVIMAAVSWVVMLGKALYLSRVAKDNKTFLADYKKLGMGDPRRLDHEDRDEDQELEDSPVSAALFGKHDHYQSSTLYRIFHQGMHEVNVRLGSAAGAQAAGLSEQAVDAIRAAVDAAVVRENQRLNAQMVLLTIAISGGPFLGLLGTVVGVMITFAAIAATGDVNINAIAPGIAAALVATVAGLAVAIPALFAYNYLGSRIKDLNADMRVFVDELVTRFAEQYGR